MCVRDCRLGSALAWFFWGRGGGETFVHLHEQNMGHHGQCRILCTLMRSIRRKNIHTHSATKVVAREIGKEGKGGAHERPLAMVSAGPVRTCVTRLAKRIPLLYSKSYDERAMTGILRGFFSPDSTVSTSTERTDSSVLLAEVANVSSASSTPSSA